MTYDCYLIGRRSEVDGVTNESMFLPTQAGRFVSMLRQTIAPLQSDCGRVGACLTSQVRRQVV